MTPIRCWLNVDDVILIDEDIRIERNVEIILNACNDVDLLVNIEEPE